MSKRLRLRSFRQTDEEFADTQDAAAKLGVGVSDLLRGVASLALEAINTNTTNPVANLIRERIAPPGASRVMQHGAPAR